MNNKNKKAIILLSGGLDSATVIAIAASQGYLCYALSFRYGQRHERELISAENIAKTNNAAQHRIIDIDLAQLGGSALTDKNIEVPKQGDDLENKNKIPITYVPARNTIFLSYALAWAEVIGAFDIFIGVNSSDYSGYPDCRAEFIKAFEKTANLATAAAIEKKGIYKIHTPIIELSKAEIITAGTKLFR